MFLWFLQKNPKKLQPLEDEYSTTPIKFTEEYKLKTG